MSQSLRSSTSEAGVPVMVKVRTGDLADRLRHEAEILAAARHPGVVELIAVNDDGARVELQLAHVVGRNLLDQPPLMAEEIAATMAEVANTLSDLHASAIVHTNVGAEHIIVDRHLHVTLCGFGSAESAATKTANIDLDPSLDIIAVGRVLDHELKRSLDEGTISDRDPLVIGLRHVADLADFASIDGRDLAMSDIAYRLSQLAGTPSDASAGESTRGRKVIHRVRSGLEGTRHTAVGLAAAVLVVSTAWVGWSYLSPTSAPDLTSAAPIQSAPLLAGDEPATTTTVSSIPPTLLQPAVAPQCPLWENDAPQVDVDGDGCTEPWWRLGAVLAVGTDRYTLGSAKDIVVLGDWNCDGSATPALIEQPSGSVYLFNTWATNGGSETTAEVRTVADAIDATASPIASCDVLTVETPTGIVTVSGAGA